MSFDPLASAERSLNSFDRDFDGSLPSEAAVAYVQMGYLRTMAHELRRMNERAEKDDQDIFDAAREKTLEGLAGILEAADYAAEIWGKIDWSYHEASGSQALGEDDGMRLNTAMDDLVAAIKEDFRRHATDRLNREGE